MSKVIYPYKKKKILFPTVSAGLGYNIALQSVFVAVYLYTKSMFNRIYIRLSKISNLCYTFIDGGKFIASVKF